MNNEFVLAAVLLLAVANVWSSRSISILRQRVEKLERALGK